MFYRIAHINEDSETGKVFAMKYNNFYPFYLGLVDNKARIEKQINAYFGDQELNIEFPASDREDSIKLEAISIHDLESLRSNLDRPDSQARQLRKEHFLKPKLTF